MKTRALRFEIALSTLALTLAFACKEQPKDRPAPTPAATTPPEVLRPAVHAGSWYPKEAPVLRHTIEMMIAAAERTPSPPSGPVLAMVGPHAGLRFSGQVAAAGYRHLKQRKVERVFLLGPSHRAFFEGVALPAPELTGYATPLGALKIDRAVVEALRGKSGFAGPANAHDQEHSLEMHAIFIAAVQPGAMLVPLVVGRVTDPRSIAAALSPLVGKNDVVIASSDFTHFGPNYQYVPFRDDVPKNLETLLEGAKKPMIDKSLDGFEAHLEKTGDTICGREPVRVLLALLPDGVTGEQIANDTSGHLTGDYSNSVSYLSVLYRRPPSAEAKPGLRQDVRVLDEAEQALALKMARATLETFLRDGRTADAKELGVPAEGPFHEHYGAFVTLKKNGDLRGCIGHILPVQPLWQDIRDNAIAAAVKDPRFQPVPAKELASLDLEISVLTRPAPISGPDAFEVGRHGVVLRALGRQAVFLPQVAVEQNWDRGTTLTHLAQKAGLPGDVWRQPVTKLDVFEAQVFGEPERGH